VQASAEGAAVVDSFDEETYSSRAGDNFRAISEQYYRSPKYERALLLFNRDHPRASDGIRQDPPVLNAGEPVFIPPIRVLEKQYGSAISESTPLPSSMTPVAPASAGSIGLAAPRPVPPTTPAISPAPAGSSGSGAPPSTSWSPPPGGPSYRVHRGGEMFRDIARRTLGNADRWWDIYRLNRSYNPADPVPAGSVLLLPLGAHVDPEDHP
jgi:nucleoid-associated protein YgaU